MPAIKRTWVTFNRETFARRRGDVLIETDTAAKARRKRSWHNLYSRKDCSGQAGEMVDL